MQNGRVIIGAQTNRFAEQVVPRGWWSRSFYEMSQFVAASPYFIPLSISLSRSVCLVDTLISSALALSCYLFDLSAFCIHTMFNNANHDVRGRLFECAKLIHFGPINSTMGEFVVVVSVDYFILFRSFVCFFFNNCRSDRVCLRNWWPSLPVPYSRKFDWSTCLNVVCSLIPFNQ